MNITKSKIAVLTPYTIIFTDGFQYPIAYGAIDYVKEDKKKKLRDVLGWMSDAVCFTLSEFFCWGERQLASYRVYSCLL